MSEQYDASRFRRFRRSTYDRRLGGVCGGLGAHLGVDPVVLRVLLVVGALAEPRVALGAYFLLLFVAPDERGASRHHVALAVVGATMVALAVIGPIVDGAVGVEKWLVPAAIVSITLLALTLPPRTPRAGTVPGAAQPEDALPTWWEVRSSSAARKPRSPLPGVTVGLAAVAAGTAVVAGATARTVTATALLAVAVGLLVGTVRGTGRPLVPVAAAVGLVLATTHYATVPAATPTSGTYIRPASVEELQDHKALTGAVTIDLSETEWVMRTGELTRRIEVVAGHVVVILPHVLRGAPHDRRPSSVSFDAGVAVGTYERWNYGRLSPLSGRGIDQGYERRMGPDPGILHLDLVVRVRVGTVEVHDGPA